MQSNHLQIIEPTLEKKWNNSMLACLLTYSYAVAIPVRPGERCEGGEVSPFCAAGPWQQLK